MHDNRSEAASCRRRSLREPVLLAGSAYAFARSQSIIISDLSPHGAQFEGHDLPPAGEDLFMVAGSFDTFGRVAWRSGDKCGIEFDEMLAGETIAQMKKEAKWESVAGWYR